MINWLHSATLSDKNGEVRIFSSEEAPPPCISAK